MLDISDGGELARGRGGSVAHNFGHPTVTDMVAIAFKDDVDSEDNQLFKLSFKYTSLDFNDIGQLSQCAIFAIDLGLT